MLNNKYFLKSAFKIPEFWVKKMLLALLSKVLSMLVRSWRLPKSYNTLINICLIKCLVTDGRFMILDIEGHSNKHPIVLLF